MFLGDGTGNFKQGPQFGTGRRPRSVVAADLDGDRDVDLVVCNQASDDVQVLLNQTDPFRAGGGGPTSPHPRPGQIVLQAEAASPAGARATLRFELSRPAVVTTTVFDLAGRRVYESREGTLTAGAHQVTWDTSAWPSGIYFVRLGAQGSESLLASRKFAVVH